MTIAAQPLRFLTPFGSKPTSPLFIFLPGMDGTGQLLQPQLAGLGTAFNMRCLSIPSDDLTDWDGLVEQTANLIQIEQKRSSHQPIYLCGESFGGCLALKLAAEFPQLCNRLILVNPASSVSRQPWMGWGVSLAQGLPTPFYQISTLGLLPFLIVPQRVSRQNRRALLTAMQSVTPKSAAWRLSLLRQFTIEELPLERIGQPTLILASRADRLLPSATEAERLVRYLPNAQKILLPQSGHACLLETEVKLVDILQSRRFYDDESQKTWGRAANFEY